MQSNTLPVFDDAQWASLLKDVDWLPSSLSSDFDFDQFLDLGLDPELAEGGASTAFGFGTSEELEQVYQGNASVSPSAELEPSSMRVSAVFNVDRLDADGNSPDFDLVASDGVHFAVNAAKLRANSLNGFNSLPVLTSSTATVPPSSTVLNLLLHTIYGISATKYTPTVDDLGAYAALYCKYEPARDCWAYFLVFQLQPSTRSSSTASPKEPLSTIRNRHYSRRFSSGRHHSRSSASYSLRMQDSMSSPSQSRPTHSPLSSPTSPTRTPIVWVLHT